MRRWKVAETDISTGFEDSAGREILVGDKVTFRRKVRAVRKWNRIGGKVTTVPGHYAMVNARVIGFGRIAKKLHFNEPVMKIEYVNLQELHNRVVFRVYRTDKLSIVYDSTKNEM